MKKLYAYVLGVFLTLTMGLTILHESYSLLASWLSPLVGSHVYTALTCTYLLVCDPLRYPGVLLTWVAAGLLIGAITRKKIVSALIAVTAWATMIPIYISSIYGLIHSLGATGIMAAANPLEMVPPVPAGLTFSRLIQTPVFGESAFRLLDAFTSSAPSFDTLFALTSPYVIPAALKPLIIAVSAVLGSLLGVKAEERGVVVNPLQRFRGRSAAQALVIMLIASSVVSPVYAVSLSDGVYLEGVAGVADDEGRTLVGMLMLGSSLDSGIPTFSMSIEGFTAAIIASQGNRGAEALNTLPLPVLQDLSSLLHLLPTTVAATVFNTGDADSVRARSHQVVESIEMTHGLEFTYLVTVNLPLEDQYGQPLPPMWISLYYSNSTIAESLGALQNDHNNGGLDDLMTEAIDAGSLLPGEGGTDVSGMAFGMVNMDPLREYIPIVAPPGYEDEYEAIMGSVMGLKAVAGFYPDSLDHSSAGGIDVVSLLGGEVPGYADNSDGSFILTGSRLTYRMSNLDLDMRMATQLPEDSLFVKLAGMILNQLGSTEINTVPEPRRLDFTIDAESMPDPPVTVEKTVEYSDGGVVVHVSATNNGAEPLYGPVLRDSTPLHYAQSRYTGETETSLNTLAPGDTLSISYSMELYTPGTYTHLPAMFSFTNHGDSYSVFSEHPDPRDVNPNILLVLIDNIQASMRLLGLLAGANRSG